MTTQINIDGIPIKLSLRMQAMIRALLQDQRRIDQIDVGTARVDWAHQRVTMRLTKHYPVTRPSETPTPPPPTERL